MIFADFAKALSQLGDPRFRKVLFLGLGLTIGLLICIYLAVIGLLNWLLPETITLPLVGEVGWIDDVLSGSSLVVMLIFSAFLMVPVASAFTSIFLDDVTDAVEAVHYPALSPAPRIGFLAGFRDSIGFLGVIVGANLVALVAYLLFAPFAPLIFVALNGFLLGREYFQLVALRRLGREGAHLARRRHAGQIWLAGAIMAAPLTVPILNLIVPLIGAAAFTHLFHRLEGPSARTSRYPRR